MQSSTLVILLVTFVGVSNAQRANNLLSYVPVDYQGYLNEQAKNDLSKLTVKDVQAFRDVASRASQFTNLSQLRNAVVNASPRATILAAKYTNDLSLRATNYYNSLVSKLSPKSKKMFGDVRETND